MSEHIGIEPTLPRGLMLANQTVLTRVASDPLGDRYTVLFGTTNHVYAVNIACSPETPITLADFEAYLARTSQLHHPCLIPYFACGSNEGVTWLRSEHSDGAPDWVTSSAEPADLPGEDENAEDIYFPTLQTLIDGSGKQIALKDRNLIIGDVAETIAYLHAHNSHAGVITPETVFLDKASKRGGLIARLRFYSWPEATTRACQINDLRQVGALILLLLAASKPDRPTRLSKALADYAQTLLNPIEIIDGQEFYETIHEMLTAHGDAHAPRIEKQPPPALAPDTEVNAPVIPDDASPDTSPHRAPRRRHHRKQGKRRFDPSSETGQMVVTVFHTGLMFAGIVGTGFGVYFGMRYLDERQRTNTLISSSERYSAISIIEDEAERGEDAQLPADIRDYTFEQLQFASGKGHATAAARLAILTLVENPADATAQAAARAMLSPHISQLKIVAMNDLAAAYWLGYAQLLGIGDDTTPDQAIQYLSQAIAGGFDDARVLLGDWLASRVSRGSSENDRLAMQQWRAAYRRPTKWAPMHTDAIARIIFFIRSGRGFKPDDSDLGELILHAATAGHLDAMLLAAECYDSGLLFKETPSTALFWLRRMASHTSATDVMRAEAQRRMADMFEKGRGAPSSFSAARIWYERAAKLGDQKAMLTLAEYCETGRGTEDNKKTPEEARYWQKQAQSTQPPPPAVLPSRLRLQPPSAIHANRTSP